jgi:hypothetical protein
MPILDSQRENALIRPPPMRKMTMESAVDPADRARDFDSGDDEMEPGDAMLETSETEADVSGNGIKDESRTHRHRRQHSSATIKPSRSPQRLPTELAELEESEMDTTLESSTGTPTTTKVQKPTTPHHARGLSRSATTHSNSTGTSNTATAIPLPASARAQPSQRRISGENLPPLSSSLATQLAMHETTLSRRKATRSSDLGGSRTGSGRSRRPVTANEILQRDRGRPGVMDDEGTEADTGDRLVSRVLLARVDQYASRIERIEGCLEQLVTELRLARAPISKST